MGRLQIIQRKDSKKRYLRREMTKYMKRKYSENTKLRWKDPDFQKQMREALCRKPNKLENDFFHEVIKEIPNLVYVGDFKFFVDGKNPDFILDENGNVSKCIDIFGDYWHQGEDPNKRIQHFKDAGYDLFVVWEYEWKNDKNTIINKIKA